MVDPTLISNKMVSFDTPPEFENIESIKVAENGIRYRPNSAMKEVVFEDKQSFLEYLYSEMENAAQNMEFEEAARIRDQIESLKKEL